MIELTPEQVHAIGKPETNGNPIRVVNPLTQEAFVLLPLKEYERLTEEEYDDSPWTAEEMEALAWHAGKMIGWEEMDEYDEEES